MFSTIPTKPRRSRKTGFAATRSKRDGLKVWCGSVRKAESQYSSLNDKAVADEAARLQDQAQADGADNTQRQIQFCGLVAEAVHRAFGFRLHDVQIMAIGAGVQGAIVQMQTGEGKTVVTGAIAAVHTLTAASIHVGTTNNYLAERDLEQTQAVFQRLGIASGLLPEENNESQSRRMYRKQIVYGPGYQYGFDYLRDQMALRADRQSDLGATTVNLIRGTNQTQSLLQVQSHQIALIDEADSVMIDEAMTPLIISLPASAHEPILAYMLAKKITKTFQEGVDFKIELPAKKIDVTDQANDRAHQAVANQRRLQLSRPWRTYLSNALRAQHVLQRDVDYVVVDDKVQIVDQFTGRIFSDRTWQDGLHQAVEAKENVPIQPGRESTTQVTRQRYLQMYDSLAGLTGTATGVEKEFQQVYHCPVIEIPTNKPCLRNQLKTRFFASAESKLAAIADDVVARHRRGQPILVGSKTIRESFDVRDALVARGLDPILLNGVQDREEAEIVSQAGAAGAITIATNMAGRGTDIKPDTEATRAGGLHVIGVSPNASKRIDRQLVGRAARQGQPGSAQFFTAAGDSLLEDNESGLSRQIKRRAKASGESANFSKQLASLQDAIEARGFKQRQKMILRDKWMDKVREAIEKD